jgi:5-methyltetrahydrofolate--homocysteine methyltransferase
MSKSLYTLLEQRSYLLADGATGTNMFAMGLQTGDAPELWNVEFPDRVESLYRHFIEAGSDIILTNTFGGNRHRLKLHNSQHRVAELNEAAARIARSVTDGLERDALVAGDMGPTGELFDPLGPLDHAEGVDTFAEQAGALERGGADLLWIETMSSMEEVRAAVEGAGTTALPIVVTASFDTNGRTMMGVKPEELAHMCEGLVPAPVALGANCGVGAAELLSCLLGLSQAAPDKILVAKANCGIPRYVDGVISYDGTPELMADYARLALDAGARIIGGCCGTTPAHLHAMRAALDAYEPGPAPGLAEIVERLGDVSAGARAEREGTRAAPQKPRRGTRRRRSPDTTRDA